VSPAHCTSGSRGLPRSTPPGSGRRYWRRRWPRASSFDARACWGSPSGSTSTGGRPESSRPPGIGTVVAQCAPDRPRRRRPRRPHGHQPADPATPESELGLPATRAARAARRVHDPAAGMPGRRRKAPAEAAGPDCLAGSARRHRDRPADVPGRPVAALAVRVRCGRHRGVPDIGAARHPSRPERPGPPGPRRPGSHPALPSSRSRAGSTPRGPRRAASTTPPCAWSSANGRWSSHGFGFWRSPAWRTRCTQSRRRYRAMVRPGRGSWVTRSGRCAGYAARPEPRRASGGAPSPRKPPRATVYTHRPFADRVTPGDALVVFYEEATPEG
jgi:hypothetical protein